MKRYIILTIITLALTATGTYMHADVSDSRILKLEQSLKYVHTPQDSIPIMYNILDLQLATGLPIISWQLYNTATHAKNDVVRLDALRHIANNMMNDSAAQGQALRLAKSIAESDIQRETVAFITMTRNTTLLKDTTYLNPRQQTELMRDIFAEYSHLDASEKYSVRSAALLYSMCMYLFSRAPGALMKDKLQELEHIVDKVATPNGPLIRLFCNFAANAYANADDFESTARLAWRQLNFINQHEAQIHASGRPYRNSDYARYTIYRCLMGAYEHLPLSEVEEIYSHITDITTRNTRAAYEMKYASRPLIYYLMANKRYDEALRLIEQRINHPLNKEKKQILYKLWIEAADKTGHKQSEIIARQRYAKLLKNNIALNDYTSSNEVELLYNTNAINTSISDIELDNRQLEVQAQRTQLYWSIGGGLILLLVIIFMYISYLKTRHMTVSLAQTNRSLKAERDAMAETHQALVAARERAKITDRKKTEFIHNISHEISQPTNAIVYFSQFIIDSVDSPRRKYLDKFIRIVESNAYILQTLVNDVLDSAEAENGLIKLYPSEFSLRQAIDNAIAQTRVSLADGVGFNITPHISEQDNDIVVNDPKRIEQILINLLGNATKFTSKGHIDIAYDIDRAARNATITITDTGCGISPSRDKDIFKPFVKLNSSTQGLGLGLYVAHLIARNLGATITVDTSYRDGAKFIFTFHF